MAEKKKFIDVEVPILNKDIRVLGTVKDLDGRTIKLDLARQLRGKGVMMTLQIFNFEERLVAIPKKTELVKSYLSRIIRKRVDIVEDSFLAHCSDIRATVKPFLITRKKVSRAVRRTLRNTAREFLINYLKEKSYNEICYEILDGSLQRNMLPKLKKIYPLAFCDIRVFETKDLMKIDVASVVVKKEEIEDVQVDLEGDSNEVSQDEEVVQEDKQVKEGEDVDTEDTEEKSSDTKEKKTASKTVKDKKPVKKAAEKKETAQKETTKKTAKKKVASTEEGERVDETEEMEETKDAVQE